MFNIFGTWLFLDQEFVVITLDSSSGDSVFDLELFHRLGGERKETIKDCFTKFFGGDHVELIPFGALEN